MPPKKSAKKTVPAKKSAKRGRPRNPVDEIPRVSDSMNSAAAMWGLSLSEIKRAKKSGCTAFVGSKVYRDRLVPWLQENPPAETGAGASETPIEEADAEELKRRKLMREVTRLDVAIKSDNHKLDVTKGQYISRDLVDEEWTRLWAIIEDEAKGLMDKTVYPVFVSRVKAKIK